MVARAFFFLFALATLSVASAKPRFPNCNPTEIALLQTQLFNAHRATVQLISALSVELKHPSAKYGWLTRQRLGKAREVLACSLVEMKRSPLRCQPLHASRSGWTLPLKGSDIHLYGVTTLKPGEAAWTILHEATHHCGTNDAAYFRGIKDGNGVPRGRGLTAWSSIADTYGFWVRAGFCVPGATCR